MKKAFSACAFCLCLTFLMLFVSCNSKEIEISELLIPMEDGVKLAADVYLPHDFDEKTRYPVLLEYLPYRKDEHRRNRYGFYSYFVKREYIVARVDIRGTGRSEGKLIEYEYTDQEQEDGEIVIQWLSEQSFSNGNIGMLGISWGGFNALHLAMRNPPALKTIISLMSTDDLYQDDVHYMDGILHVDAYEIGQDLANILPAPPEFEIDSAYFANRFDTEPWLLIYKRQQRDGPFWNRASLKEDYSKIKIPTFLIGGYYDGYRDFVPRFLGNTNVPVKAILGPWNHIWPNRADPGPAIEWREKAVQWCDHWLKGEENDIMKEPPIVFYQRDHHVPGFDLDFIPGYWKAYEKWPPQGIVNTHLFFSKESSLHSEVGMAGQDDIKNKVSDAVDAGGSVMWWGDWAKDQTEADKNSLVYESAVLENDVEIMGFPKVKMWASSDRTHANWIVRLNDVAPDGKVTLVTGAGMNGTHLISAETPEHMEPDSIYEFNIEMHFASWTFRKGHRIRVSLSNTQWPMFWPTAEMPLSKVHFGRNQPSQLILPLTPPSLLGMPYFSDPEPDPVLKSYHLLPGSTGSGFAEVNEVMRDTISGIAKVVAKNGGIEMYPWGEHVFQESIIHESHEYNPSKTSLYSEYSTEVRLEKRHLKWVTNLVFTSDRDSFYYDYQRQLFEDDILLRTKNWKESIIRDFQ